MSKLTLANEMIDLAVEHSIHRSGRVHRQTPSQKILELLAGELIELASATNSVDRHFELADVYIALRHYQKKEEISDEELAILVACKLDSRNKISPDDCQEAIRFKDLKHEIEFK